MTKFDEMYTSLPYDLFSGGEKIRDHYKIYDEWLARQPGDMMVNRREQDELNFRRVGITFAVYGDKDELGVGTARLMDVKFHAVQSDFYGAASESGQEYDFYHWSAILRSVSGFEIYRKVYRDVIKPERVAELMILRPDMPRSLLASMNEVVNNLGMLATERSSDTQRRARKLCAELKYGQIELPAAD